MYSKWILRHLVPFGALLAIAVFCTAQVARAQNSDIAVPCAARANAVIANTGNVYLNSNSLVDSYQSTLGAYGGSNVGNKGAVVAAMRVADNGGVVHGSTSQHSPAGLPVVPVPAGAKNLPLGSSSPGSLDINSSGQRITLAPGNYVAANISVNSPGAIAISPPGPVNIWVTGNLNLGGNENLNGVPDNLAFIVSSSNWVNVNASGRLYGFIYAPTSSINLNSTVFGAVVGSTVTLNSGSAVHFDENSVCPSNLGCGQPCSDNSQCASKFCVNNACDSDVMASGQNQPMQLRSDAANLYFNTADAIMSLPLSGGAPIALTSGPIKVDDDCLAVDSNFVYWADGSINSVKGAPIPTGTPTPVPPVTINIASPNAGELLPYSCVAVIPSTPSGLLLYTMGGPSFVVEVPSVGNSTEFTIPGNGPFVRLAATATTGYVTVSPFATSPTLFSIDFASMTESVFAADMFPDRNRITVDGTNLYATVLGTDPHGSGGSVVQFPLNRVGSPVVLASMVAPAKPTNLVVDASNVYWTDATGAVYRVPIGGGTVTTLGCNQAQPWGIAQDTNYVYWTDVTLGTVKRAHK